MSKKREFSYYDFHKALSYNALITMIVGARGVGKTYGAKRDAIKAYLRDGSQFIYLRRYQDEMKTKQTFFNDIGEAFSNLGFRVNGDLAQLTRNPEDEKPKWETFGYFRVLSKAQSQKSQAFPAVTRILFDEFIIEKDRHHHYLQNEVDVLMGFLVTVDRGQDRCRVIMMANSASIMNPYFLAWKVKPKQEFVVRKDGRDVQVVTHFVDSRDFKQEFIETRVGRLIAGTGYGDYAMGNVFADANDYLIARKSANATYWFTIETPEGEFSLWYDKKAPYPTYFVQEKQPGNKIVFVTRPELMSDGKILLYSSDTKLSGLRGAYARGYVMFDSATARNSFIQIFDRR